MWYTILTFLVWAIWMLQRLAGLISIGSVTLTDNLFIGAIFGIWIHFGLVYLVYTLSLTNWSRARYKAYEKRWPEEPVSKFPLFRTVWYWRDTAAKLALGQKLVIIYGLGNEWRGLHDWQAGEFSATREGK